MKMNLLSPFSRLRKTLLLLLTGLFAVNAVSLAQSPCDLQPSIIVNTGYDPNAPGSVISVGDIDPFWRVTNLSTDCVPFCAGYVSPGTNDAYAVTPLSASGPYFWVTNPASQWLCFNTTTGIPGYSTTAGSTYTMTLTRTFKTCIEDDIAFDFMIANDNYISDINVDGQHIIFSQPQSNPASNFNSFTPMTQTLRLSPGTHYINVTVVNYEPNNHPSDYHGLNIVGTVSSAGGIHSIAGPASTPNCCCSDVMPCDAEVQLSAVFNGRDEEGNCVYDCSANVAGGSGWTPVSYKWETPALPLFSWPAFSVTNPSSSFTDNQFITIPNGSSHVKVTVTVTLVNDQGETCRVVSFRYIDCTDEQGYSMQKGSAVDDNKYQTGAMDIYPNPANDVVTIESQAKEITHVQVIDIAGKTVAEYTYTPQSKVAVQLSKLPAGTYTIKVNETVSKLINKID